MRIVKELVGKEVLSADAVVKGKIIDVDIAIKGDTFDPMAIIVSKGGVQQTLNIKKGELVVPWDMVKSIGDKVILVDAFDGESKAGISNEFVSDDEELDLNKFEKELDDLKSSL